MIIFYCSKCDKYIPYKHINILHDIGGSYWKCKKCNTETIKVFSVDKKQLRKIKLDEIRKLKKIT